MVLLFVFWIKLNTTPAMNVKRNDFFAHGFSFRARKKMNV